MHSPGCVLAENLWIFLLCCTTFHKWNAEWNMETSVIFLKAFSTTTVMPFPKYLELYVVQQKSSKLAKYKWTFCVCLSVFLEPTHYCYAILEHVGAFIHMDLFHRIISAALLCFTFLCTVLLFSLIGRRKQCPVMLTFFVYWVVVVMFVSLYILKHTAHSCFVNVHVYSVLCTVRLCSGDCLCSGIYLLFLVIWIYCSS